MQDQLELEMPSRFTHKEMVEIAYRWLIGRVGFAFKELRALTYECPDVIGFRSGESILIECKVSRADFLCDKKKPFRVNPEQGMGNYRLYCCPTGMIKKEELPAKWGLLYVSAAGKCRIVHNPFNGKGGNMYLDENKFEANKREEMAMMYSALRRLHLRNRIDEIYSVQEEEQVNPESNEQLFDSTTLKQ